MRAPNQEPIQIITENGFTLKIFVDKSPSDPMESGLFGEIVHLHNSIVLTNREGSKDFNDDFGAVYISEIQSGNKPYRTYYICEKSDLLSFGKRTISEAESLFRASVKKIQQYFNGECYRFTLTDPDGKVTSQGSYYGLDSALEAGKKALKTAFELAEFLKNPPQFPE